MARLGLAIHEFACDSSPSTEKLVDARAKPWHDGEGTSGRREPSGDDIRQQLALELDDLVLEDQLALFQALDLELVEGGRLRHALDGRVQVAVLGTKLFQLGPKLARPDDDGHRLLL